MLYTVNQGALEATKQADTIAEVSEGVRFAQSRFLDELPGAAFAAITLIWVVSEFAKLIW